LIKVNILKYYHKFIEKSRSFCAGVVRKLQRGCRIFIEKSGSFCTEVLRKLKSFCAGIVRQLKSFGAGLLRKLKSFCTGIVRQLKSFGAGLLRKLKSFCTGILRKQGPFCAGVVRQLKSFGDGLLRKLKSFCTAVGRKLQYGCRIFIEKSGSFCTEVLRKLKSFCTGIVRQLKSFGAGLLRKLRPFCAGILRSIRHIKGWQIDIIFVVIAVAFLVFFLVNRAYQRANETDRINISISSQCRNLFGRDIVDALIREFEELNPDLRIQEITRDATVDEAEVGSADIIFFDDGGYCNLINASALASLASYHHAEGQTGKWALPLVTFMDLFIYNIDILKAANLDRPPKTRAEFLAAAKAVMENNAAPPEQESVFAFALGLSPADPLALRRDFYPWVWATGGEVRLQTDEPALPRAVTDAIAFLGQLNREGLLAPGTFEKTGAQRLQEFAEGKIAMMTISARDLAFLQNNAQGITFGITTLPAMTQGKNRMGLSSVYAGISSECSLPDEAWRFLAFFAGKKNILAEALGAVPGSFPNVFAGEYIAQNPLYSKAWDIFEAADIVEYEPGQPPEEEFNHLIRKKLAEAFEG